MRHLNQDTCQREPILVPLDIRDQAAESVSRDTYIWILSI